MANANGSDKAELVSAEKLLGMNNVDLSCKVGEFSKYTFWYYTSIETASKILESNSFYANNLRRMNDKAEAERHRCVNDKVHALCFCNSNTEKIPMWYMYGGITGKGVAIGLTPSVMLQFIKSIDVIQNPDVNGKEKILKKGIDYYIQIGHVYYVDYSRKIKFGRKWYRIDKADMNKFCRDNYFVKDYPWEYEKEFRIVINTKEPCDRVEIFLPENILPKLKIKFAPEIKREKLWDQIKDYEGFRRYYESRFLYSSLNVEMSLINRNLSEFGYYLEQLKKKNVEEYRKVLKRIGVGD